MNLPKKKKFELEGLISPLAMASLQTQFVVGNRQQFGFLYGDVLISNETYRCDDDFCSNTFYITSVVPVFDAASFQSDLLKSNDKHLSDTFLKYAVKNKIRQPILGWYIQGDPNELLKGKDYSLHVKLLRQTLLLNKGMVGTYFDDIAYHSFFVAVVSYDKKRFSRDFSIGFQGFDDKNQLRMYEVKVNVVDHYFRPRYETDGCIVNHSEIFEYIRQQIESEELRGIFGRLLEGVFDRPEPYSYQVHGHLINRCFDLLSGTLKNYCTRASESRNVELESQLFDYKAFDVDSKAYLAAMTMIDKKERNLGLYNIMQLLHDLDYAPSGSAVSVVQVGGSPPLSKPQIVAETLKEPHPSAAGKQTEKISSAESTSTEKVNPPTLSSGSSYQNSKDSVNQLVGVSIQKFENPVEVSIAESVHLDATKSTSEDESPLKATDTKVSKSKKRRNRKNRGGSSVNVKDNSTTVADNSAAQTSPEKQNSGTPSIENNQNTSPFSNVPRDQLLVYSINTQNKSNETKLPELGSFSAEICQHESDNASISDTSEEEITDSKPSEMQIRIVKRNTSARVHIPHTPIKEKTNPTEMVEKAGKKKESSGSYEFVGRNLKKSGEPTVKKCSDAADSGNTSSSKHNKAEQTLMPAIGQDAEHPSKEELKYESQTSAHVPRLVGGTEKLVSYGETSSTKSEHISNQKEAIEKTYQVLGKRKLPSVTSFLPNRPKVPEGWIEAAVDYAVRRIDQLVEEEELKIRSSGEAEVKGIDENLHLNPALDSTDKVTTAPSAQVSSERIATHSTTPVVFHEKASIASPEAPLTDSSRKVRSRKSKSRKSTSQLQESADGSPMLPWPRSKNACIIIPKIKNVPKNELWKYALHPIPESLLTALKSLRTWRNKANVEAQTNSISGSSTKITDSDEQLLPDFQEAFGSRLGRESWKNLQCEGKSLPPISEAAVDFPQLPEGPPLPSQSKLNRFKKYLFSRRRSLRRKSAFLSTRRTSPLETVFEERRSTSVEYEHSSTSEFKFDICKEFIPLCLLGDKFMITGVSTEEKYEALSTISSDDSDTETSTSF